MDVVAGALGDPVSDPVSTNDLESFRSSKVPLLLLGEVAVEQGSRSASCLSHPTLQRFATGELPLGGVGGTASHEGFPSLWDHLCEGSDVDPPFTLNADAAAGEA
jgi:hypothetical protein